LKYIESVVFHYKCDFLIINYTYACVLPNSHQEPRTAKLGRASGNINARTVITS